MIEVKESRNLVTWGDAMDHALATGWRLPTIKELMLIYASPMADQWADGAKFWSSEQCDWYCGFAV